MEDKKTDNLKSKHLLDEHFITKDEIQELVLSIEKLEQGIEDLKKSNRGLIRDIITIKSVVVNELADSLTFRMFIVAAIFGFTQLVIVYLAM